MKFKTIYAKFNNFPTIVVSILIVVVISYFFSFLFPFTNNAFVVANITPVAADVSGFITDMYIINGQEVKKDAPLFKVFQEPYRLAYTQALAEYEEAQAHIEVLKNETAKNEALLLSTKDEYHKTKYEYDLKKDPLVSRSVSLLEVKTLALQVSALANKVLAVQKQLAVDDSEIKQQYKKIAALKAAYQNAQVNLGLTIVRASVSGIVENMYLAKGTPIIQHQPLFSLIDMNNIYVQANFNEIDLRHVRSGDKVLIIPRMYVGSKVYHGVVISKVWGANRQITSARNQLQIITENENNWVLLPQRLPVQIQITDYDHVNYPLSMGASAYVYIQTH